MQIRKTGTPTSDHLRREWSKYTQSDSSQSKRKSSLSSAETSSTRNSAMGRAIFLNLNVQRRSVVAICDFHEPL